MATNVLRIKRPNQYMSSTNGLISSVRSKQSQQPTGMASSFSPAAGRMISSGLKTAASASPFTSGASALTSGIKKAQSIYKPRQAQAAPITSVAPKQIQGSGYGSQYTSNAGNYKPRVSVPRPVVAPTRPNPGATYLAEAQAMGQKQKTLAEQQQAQKADYIRSQYGLANQALENTIGQAEGEFGDFKSEQEATIADLLASGERQKGQTSDYYGEAQRNAAQTRRETQGQTQRTFANLGTLDSRGEGSFAQATENADSDFNRFTQKNLMEKANKLSEIDAAIGAAERQAKAAITAEGRKLTGLIQQIRIAQSQNKLDEVAQLTEAYNQTQQSIYEIEDTMNQLKYTFAKEQQELETEMAKVQSFSPEFMAGGPPTNQAEFEFFYKNMNGGNAKPKSSTSLQVEGKAGAGLRALQTIESEILSNPNILAQAAIPGSPGARQYEAAVSSITDAIGGLRTGASVSPEQQRFYRNLLPKVGDSQETINYKLNAIRQELTGYSQGAGNVGDDVPPELLSILGLN